MSSRYLGLMITTLLTIACNRPAPAPTTPAAAPAAAPTPTSVGTAKAFEGRDLAVKPGDDFFAYANGGWSKSTQIPGDRSSWGAGSQVQELADKRQADLIQEISKMSAPQGDAKRIADYYATFMDEAAIESKGLAQLSDDLAAIDAIKTTSDLATAIGKQMRADVDILNATTMHTPNVFGLWIAQDLDTPSEYAVFIIQGGLGMPDRDFYVDESPKMASIRTEYHKYVENMLKLSGDKEAAKNADGILALETKIAKTHASVSDSLDAKKGNNHWLRSDFDKRARGMDWKAFFLAAQLGAFSKFVVWQPSAVTGVAKLVATQPLQSWKTYLRFHVLNKHAAYLPKAYVQESFHFFGTVLSGTPNLRDRWKRGINVTNAALGEAVGRLYVERYFPASEKQRARELVRNIIAAFDKRIDKLEWMSPQTKARAKKKLANLKVGVGYPDKWRDYSSLVVVRGDAIGNLKRAETFEYQRNLKKLGQPIDRDEWVMNPQLVNAVNLPVMIAIQFPAAILQPPFFGPNQSDAMNYGGIGAVIGHEISHAFDSLGALFDENGKLTNWWTKDDYAHFQAATEALSRQYDAYKPFPDLAIKGKQTLGESVADLAGLAAAYDGFRLSLQGKPAPVVEGLDGDQQFFVSYAQSWREKTRDEALRQQIITNEHAPAQYRVYTVRNIDSWYDAFQVKSGDKLHLAPADRVRIW